MTAYELEVDLPGFLAISTGRRLWSTVVLCDNDTDAEVAATLWRDNLADTLGCDARQIGIVHVRTACVARLVWHDMATLGDGDALASLVSSEYRFVARVFPTT